jgi:hypothetical protein
MHATEHGRPGMPRWTFPLAAIGGAAFYLWNAWRRVGHLGLPLDDSWIHLHFARSLAAGHGLAFSPGELVAGSTAPLWTAVLALLALLPGSAVAWSQAVGMAMFGCATVAFHRLGRDLGLGPAATTLATLLFVASGPLAWSAVSGLEIPLFVLLSLVAVRLHLGDRGGTAGIALSVAVFGLAALARPEGVLLLALAVVDRLLARRGALSAWWRGLWPGLALALALVAPVAALYWAVSGSPLPTTFAAKSGGMARTLPDLRYLHTVAGILFRSQPYMTLLAGAGAVVLVRRSGSVEDRGVLPALWLAGLPLAYSCLGSAGGPLVGNFGRYHYPLLPFVILLGCLGASELAATERRLPRPALVLAALLVLWPTVSQWRTHGQQFVRNVEDVERGDVAAATWLESRLAPGATLAVNDIGAIQYLLPDHRIFDLAGIVSPEVHEFTHRAVRQGRPWQAGVRDYLERARPDYLVVFPRWFPDLVSSGVSFQPIQEFPVPANITLGGDRLVIYRTPWTRVSLP